MNTGMTTMRDVWSTVVRRWKQFASFLGRWNSRLVLTLLYLILVGPIAIVLKVLGKDPLDRKRKSVSSYWKDKEPLDSSLERNTYQF